MSDPLLFAGAVELVDRLRSREVSATEIVGAHLDRISETNGEINAIVALRDRDKILADASAADSATPTGALHGLPVAVKDLEDVLGLPTRLGSLTTSDNPAVADGLAAERLRSAGAIIIGKTNTPEFGTGSHTFNEVYGLTRNPWDPTKSAGGSSGGAAAALASGMLPIADGTDFGGSLRNPAGFCNVVGLRPSIGRVPSPCDVSTHLDRLGVSGPMGRTVADTALLLSALAGPDRRDPLSLPDDPRVFAEPLPDTTRAQVGWLGDLGEFSCEAEVLEICGSAVGRVEQAGGRVQDASVDLSDAMRVFRVLRGLRYRQIGSKIPAEKWDLLKATNIENIEYGRTLGVDDVLRAESDRAQLHHEMQRAFERHDVLALPTAQVAPFPAEWEYPTEVAGVQMVDYLDWMTACCIITPTGCPAISIPAGFSSDGLPVGLQLVAPVGQDRKLLEVAAAIEAVEPFHNLHPAPLVQRG